MLQLSLVNKQLHGVMADDRLWYAVAQQHNPGYFAKIPYATLKQTGSWKHDAMMPVMKRFNRLKNLDEHQDILTAWEDVLVTNDKEHTVSYQYAIDSDNDFPALFRARHADLGVVFLLIKPAPESGKEWTESIPGLNVHPAYDATVVQSGKDPNDICVGPYAFHAASGFVVGLYKEGIMQFMHLHSEKNRLTTLSKHLLSDEMDYVSARFTQDGWATRRWAT
jgi:hypothetical protein